jgi:C1A family cysteine protease
MELTAPRVPRPRQAGLFLRRLQVLFSTAALLSCSLWAAAGSPVGKEFAELTVENRTYQRVVVLGVSSSSVTIRHSGGISQIELKKLPLDLQQLFNYNPHAAEQDQKLILEQSRQRALEEASRLAAASKTKAGIVDDSPTGKAMALFGQPPRYESIDLRSRFRELELFTKSQGLRPSCSVFATVGALELQYAMATGEAQQFSEEYLIWATRRSLGLADGSKRVVPSRDDEDEIADAGFTVQEVTAALRAFGIALQSEMPNRVLGGMETIPPPPPTVVTEAQTRRKISAYAVPGATTQVRINNIIHCLNAGVPVVVGMRWPNSRVLRNNALLAEQIPMKGSYHAVTIVGYTTALHTDGVRKIQFIFRNSWGVRWGAGGYGFADIKYLEKNLTDAVILEISQRK